MSKPKYTAVDTPATVKLVRHSGDDKAVVDSARVSFASIDEMRERVEGSDRSVRSEIYASLNISRSISTCLLSSTAI